MSAVPQFLKRLESRIAIALSRADSAIKALTALGNNLSQLNAAPIGPALSVKWTSSTFTPSASGSGKVLVLGFATINPGTNTDQLIVQIIRDAATGVGPFSTSTITGGQAFGVVCWIDQVTPGTPHTWSVQASSPANVTIPAAEAVVVLIELP